MDTSAWIMTVVGWMGVTFVFWMLWGQRRNQKENQENREYVDKWVPLLNEQIQIDNFSIKGYQVYLLLWQHQQGMHTKPMNLWCLLCRDNRTVDTNTMQEMNRIGHTITPDSLN